MSDEADVEQGLQELAAQMELSKGDYPHPAGKDTLLQFVREVVKEDKTERLRKLGYLWPEEIGKAKIPLRAWESLAVYAAQEGLELVAAYLRNRGSVLPTTSLSRKGFLLQQPGTVRRKTQSAGSPKETTEKGLFGKEKVVKEGTEFD